LGRSLGIDLIPQKTCTFDCLYCQVGRTTCMTLERKDWVPLSEIRSELESKLDTAPEVITFSGSGEPTLHERLGEMIETVRKLTAIPVAVLTNGSLLWEPEVRSSLLQADLVVPSLDAPDPTRFRQINRPHPDLSFEQMIGGLIAFGQAFPGRLWLEIFLLRGLNDAPSDLEKMAALAERIRPERIQLNTVTRPPADPEARAVPAEAMARIASIFGPRAEVIGGFESPGQSPESPVRKEDILHMLRRRPCTLDDLVQGLGIRRSDAARAVEDLEVEGRIGRERVEGNVYYSPRD
jgi:wyosine [tRNA(Phe)-imidazoG37] synthetase (radical SAM superfamily)